MSWNLNGTYFENCNCDMVCPCTTSGLTMPATNDRCVVAFVFHVDNGAIDGVDVSNTSVIVVADTPKVMADGNWRVGLIIDSAADASQSTKLEAVFSGQRGGPMAMLAPLIGEALGRQSVPIAYANDGRRHSVKAGGLLDIEIEDFVPPMSHTGEVARLSGMLHVANSNLTIAKATRAQISVFGLARQNAGLNGHSAPFSWAA